MFGTAKDLIFPFGDSITRHGYDQEQGFGWTAALAYAYMRRLNVLNAGLSGYCTRKALAVLPHIIPPPDQARIRIMSIFFGANDARLPNTSQPAQHVPLEQYKANLKAMISSPLVKAHNPRIVLITPPPIDERMCEEADRANGINEVRRRAEVTAKYAVAVREVSEEMDLTLLDLWSIFMDRAGWKAGAPLLGSRDVEQSSENGLPSLLKDGLHLTAEGNRVLYEELIALIEREWPGLTPEALPFVLPAWDDSEAWKDFETPSL